MVVLHEGTIFMSRVKLSFHNVEWAASVSILKGTLAAEGPREPPMIRSWPALIRPRTALR